MNKNNLIWFAQSLIFLPFVAGAVPLGNILKVNTTKETVQTVFIKKENIDPVRGSLAEVLRTRDFVASETSNGIEANGILAFNQVLDQKAEDLKTKAEAIDGYFRSYDMPLLGMGMKMVEEAEKNNLDWRLLPAIAVRESTGGKYDCIKVEYNSFGWGSCKIDFNSIEESIEIIARNLGGNNPNTERHYANKNLKEILRAYNPPSIIPRYAEQVIFIMNAIGEENLTTEANA